MSKSEILSSVITVLSFLITIGTLGVKLVSLLEKLKNKVDFLREELQETRIEHKQQLERLDDRLRCLEQAPREAYPPVYPGGFRRQTPERHP